MSPLAIATAMGCAAWKNFSSTSRPASAKYPRSTATKLPEWEVKRSAPTLILVFAAMAGAGREPAATAPAIRASALRRFSLVMSFSIVTCTG